MAKITEYTVTDREQWNSVVRSFSDYDVFYLNEYVTAFMNEEKKNGTPTLLLFENGSDRAMNVVFRRDVADDGKFSEKIPRDTYYDLISPYGYGGFWGKVGDYDTLNKTYNSYCLQNGYICEFVRFELFSDYHLHYDGETETRTHNVVRSLEMPLNEMWMDFKQKVRKNVKRAQRNNLEIIVENTEAHLQDFLDIYYSTMDRSNADDDYYFSKEFYQALNEMRDNVMYFYVLYEGKVISTELVIYGAENCYSYLGGTYRDYFDLRPNDFLKYEIIKWARDKGLKNFVLGGGYGADDGIFQYKTCLAPKGVVDFFIGRKVFDEEKYQALVSIRRKNDMNIEESKFFPAYRV